jgi:hypothetical protein
MMQTISGMDAVQATVDDENRNELKQNPIEDVSDRMPLCRFRGIEQKNQNRHDRMHCQEF